MRGARHFKEWGHPAPLPMERAKESRQAAALAPRIGHGGGTPLLLECGGSPPPGAGAGMPAVARSIQG